MLITPPDEILPVPAGDAERRLYCCGLKALLNDALRIRPSFRGALASGQRIAHRAAVELPDPCAFDGSWARLLIRIRRHPRWGGLGPADHAGSDPWQRTLPAPVLLHARAGRTAAGELAVQWCVPEGPPPLAHRANPATGLLVAGEGPADLRLVLPSLPAAAAGEVAEISASPRRQQPRLLTVGRRFHGDTRVPYLRLSGRWLGALGFHEGNAIDVRTAPGRITLDALPPPEEEPPADATAPA